MWTSHVTEKLIIVQMILIARNAKNLSGSLYLIENTISQTLYFMATLDINY